MSGPSGMKLRPLFVSQVAELQRPELRFGEAELALLVRFADPDSDGTLSLAEVEDAARRAKLSGDALRVERHMHHVLHALERAMAARQLRLQDLSDERARAPPRRALGDEAEARPPSPSLAPPSRPPPGSKSSTTTARG